MRPLHANKQTILHFNLTVQNPVSSKKYFDQNFTSVFQNKIVLPLSINYSKPNSQGPQKPPPPRLKYDTHFSEKKLFTSRFSGGNDFHHVISHTNDVT